MAAMASPALPTATTSVRLDGSTSNLRAVLYPKTSGPRRQWPRRAGLLLAVIALSACASVRGPATKDWRAYFQSTSVETVHAKKDASHSELEEEKAFLRAPSESTGATPTTPKRRRGRDSGGKQRRPASERFVPSRNGTAWSLPDTAFTPHILRLVEFAQRIKEHCVKPRGKFALMNVDVQSPASVTVSLAQPGDGYIHRWYKVVLQNKLLRNGRVLPTGNVTLAVSGDDRNERSDVCFFANSAPGGEHTVFNFQDVVRWAKAEKLPPPRPWDERGAVPVFRGRLWGVTGRMLDDVRREMEGRPNLTQHEADAIFERDVLNDGDVHRRGALVYFSKRHPELVDARIHGYGPRAAEMYLQNATNGLHRILPLDQIPTDDYYTRHRTHVVMGGAGAAFRLSSLLGQEVATIVQEYPYKEWFAHLMEPFVHFIPLDQGLANLSETLHWVKDNPNEVRQIAVNGKVFYDRYLSFDRMGSFYHELIFRLMLCCGSLSPGAIIT
ncbi:hypothetical protein ACHAXT_011978 [Thalassiosira profunda]